MSRFARISDREHILPDPSVVWLKAKLLQGTVDVGRVSRPLDIVQMLAYFVVAGGWAGLLTWRWNAVEAWMRSFTPDGPRHDRGHARRIAVDVVLRDGVRAGVDDGDAGAAHDSGGGVADERLSR